MSRVNYTPAPASHESFVYGVFDRIDGHSHCWANVMLAPADERGEPDWNGAKPDSLIELPADEWPQDPQAARRVCIFVAKIGGCDPETALIIRFHPEFGALHVAGPEADHAIAAAIISRDLGTAAPIAELSDLQKGLLDFQADRERKAANDNAPGPIDRLKRFKAQYGGEIHTSGATTMLYRAMIDGEVWNVGIGADGEAFKISTLGRGGRIPIAEPQPLRFVCPTMWHGQPIPARSWYLPDLIPMRQVTILNGDGGVGKSLLALQVGAAGALECETLGFLPLAGRVLYVGAEDEADEFHRRLADIAHQHQRHLADLGDFLLVPLADRDALLSVPQKDGTMKPTALWSDIAAKAADWRPRLIILDTSADLFGGDEIKRSQVRQFVSMLRKLAIDVDCAVLLLSHPSVAGMQTGSGSSGSTAWNNSSRSRLYLTRDKDDEDLRILTTMKANYGKIGATVRMRWQDGAFILDDGKPSVAAGLINGRADKAFLALLSEINRTGRRVSSSRSVTYAPTVLAEMPGSEGLNKKVLEEAMKRLFASGAIKVVNEGPPSKSRQRLVVVADEIAARRDCSNGASDGLPTGTNGGTFRPPCTPVGLEHPTPVGTGSEFHPWSGRKAEAS